MSDARRISLAELNALSRAEFARHLGGVFERSPWVADAAADGRPFSDVERLHRAMMAALVARPLEEQIAFLRAHPPLAARERRQQAITEESSVEQREAGLDAVEASKGDLLDRLNAAYHERFGFPFIIAARYNTVDSIVATLRQRLDRTDREEIAEAFRQIALITRLRLDDLVSDGPR